ncbi:MAG: class I SAM-dependent methyltransferase [Planctomycetes bacterium]|nr:class I SAM-dependent methyltransferase [Planctomycetota bacterium]
MTSDSRAYSDRHLDPREAIAYRAKFRRGILRRLSHFEERRIVRKAFQEALDLLPPAIIEEEGRPRLLDYPCGAGRFARLFANGANRLGGRYIAADHSPSMLAICARELEEHDVVAEAFVEGDARDMPLADAAFDIACCIRLLHHFRPREERVRILSEFRRVSTGPLVATFLDAEAAKQRRHSERCRREGRENRRAIVTRAELQHEASDAGYRLVSVRELSGRFSGQCVAVFTPVDKIVVTTPVSHDLAE